MTDRLPPMLGLPAVLARGVGFGLAAILLVILNMATLPFGVLVEPLWWPTARLRLLRFPNGLPLLVPTSLVLGGYAAWRHILAAGLPVTLAGWILTPLAAIALFAILIAVNTWKRTRAS